MSGLTAIFGNSEEDSPDNEKLLDLYWNRNELKKEFAGMRTEQFRLQDRIREHEGVAARLQQKLDNLEDLLIDPEWARNVLVFYQLRSLALRCENKLAKFAEQLKQQREHKQHKKLLADWNSVREQESSALTTEILERRDSVQQLEDQIHAERRRVQSFSGFMRFFKRRSADAILESLTEQLQIQSLSEEGLTRQIDEIKSRAPPDALGLDIAAKRSINYMIISYAQQLYIQFDDDTLVGLVKEAREKSVGSVVYGSESDCELILNKIRSCIDAMDCDTNFAEILQKRAKLISDKAMFMNDEDAVPASGTVTTLFKFSENDEIRESDLNLLGENYWEIAKSLSR